MVLRDVQSADFDSILALNEEWVHFLSPMDLAELREMHGEAAYHRLVEEEAEPLAFLLVFRQGADYSSPNYQWFAQRYDRFLYVDRIAVSDAARGKGVGRLLYEDLFRFAGAEGCSRVTCEYNVDPPNPGSAAFHHRLGFREVGQQSLAGGSKRVSLQLREWEAVSAEEGC